MIAEWLGNLFVALLDFLVFLVTDLGPLTLVLIIIAVYAAWRLSLTFGPMKTCWRCKGKGAVGGLFGGKKVCGSCNGDGIRKRVGAN